jgi:[NiFe] hydrogenase assembly HybE family chaperone
MTMSAEAIGARLAAVYREIEATAMRDAPICNRALKVEAIGFREFSDYVLGIIITPWFLNIFVARACADGAPSLPDGSLQLRFPAGAVDFSVRELEGFGRLASASLFSPMSDFADQAAAREVASTALAALFDADLHAPAPAPAKAFDRRALFGGGRDARREALR